MDGCIFCKIINGKAPCKLVYEDETVMAILSIDPVSKGHTVLIPKKHSVNVFDTDDRIMEHIGLKLKELSLKLIEDNNAKGINILNANGAIAQQSVNHLHFHLVPRYPNDGLDLWIRQGL